MAVSMNMHDYANWKRLTTGLPFVSLYYVMCIKVDKSAALYKY